MSKNLLRLSRAGCALQVSIRILLNRTERETGEMKKNCVDQMVGLPAEAEAGCLSGPTGLGGITSLVIIPGIETSKLNIRLQSTVSLSIQARSTDYSKMSSKSAVATNSFLVLNAPTKKVQDYKQMKPNGAVSWVWDHFSAPRIDLIIKI